MASNVNLIVDYVIFAAVLLISLVISKYYSLRQKSADEYMHGQRSMSLLPVSFSLAVTVVSAVTVQGVPAEVYLYGIEIIVTVIGFIIGGVIVNFTFLPLYYNLKLTSIYEYFELRYKSRIPQIIGSVFAICYYTLRSRILLYGPALAVESMLQFPTIYIILIMAVVCSIYTAFGGIRAVIWTDFFQSIVMILRLIIVLILGAKDVGLSVLWSELVNNNRANLNIGLSVTQRTSVWIYCASYVVRTIQIMSNQMSMVRFLGLPTMCKAKLANFIGIIGIIFIQILCISLGGLIFSHYSSVGCGGPLENGILYSANQVLPYYITEVLTYPGLPGLFISVYVAASMSSISSAQNAIAALVWKDMLSSNLYHISEFRKVIVIKAIVLIFSRLVIVVAFLAKYAGGTLVQISSVLAGALQTPVFGMFILGASFDFTSSIAAVTGCLCGSALSSWMAVGNIIYKDDLLWEKHTPIAVSIANNNTCPDLDLAQLNSSHIIYHFTAEYDHLDRHSLISFYSISPFLYPVVGMCVTIVVGLLLSLLPCCKHKSPVSRNLMFTFKQRKMEKEEVNVEDHDIDTKL